MKKRNLKKMAAAFVAALSLILFQNCTSGFDLSSSSSSADPSLFPDAAHEVSITLAWDPSSSTQTVCYRIYHGSDPSNLSQSVSFGKVTSGKIDHLSLTGKYYFAAVALDSSGHESPRTPVLVYSK